MDYTVTAKGSVGSEGREAHFIVAIAHQKDGVLCEQYEGKINESQISSKHFLKKLSIDARFQKSQDFFQMNVLYQAVKKARQALNTVGAIKFSMSILACRFYSYKKYFNYVKSELHIQVFEKYINYETFE